MNCDRIARVYRWLEYTAFGRELERRRFQYLTDVAGARNVLILGEGDGRFLARFKKISPYSSVHYIDSSARMLAIARERAGTRGICYELGDARTMSLGTRSFDLIVTHFFLDCFDACEQQRVIGLIAEAAASNSKWLISEFRQPRGGVEAAWGWAWLHLLYFFFGISTKLKTRALADHRPVLASHGFRLEREEISWFGLLASELWVRDF